MLFIYYLVKGNHTMIIYKSHKIDNLNTYTVIVKKDGLEYSREVIIPLYSIKKENYDYLILLDDDSHVIHKAYSFLNRSIGNSSYNTRMQNAKAIRLLYCWQSLSKYNITMLSESQCDELISFLRGLSIQFETESERVLRSNATVNIYLSAIRNYLHFLGVEKCPLFRTGVSKITFTGNGDMPSSAESLSYDKNLPTTKYERKQTVPKYISPEQFRKLMIAAIAHKDRTAQILFHLMYGYGLRLGECLGLTLEDIKEVHRDNKTIPILIIRNRYSDAPRFQSAKGKMHITDRQQYKLSDYQKSKDEIVITYDFYEQLITYINDMHSELSEKYPENYATGNADIVSQKNKPDFNHYVFLNRYGKVLTDQTWNNTLKLYFKEAGIQIDYETRETNLSHRFRHGFAMFMAHFSPKPLNVLELQKLMRHKSISSTMVYYNPTPEDEANIKEEAQEYLYSQIPELKGDF